MNNHELVLYVFRSKLPDQTLIVYPATSPIEAYCNLMKDLHRFYPEKEQFLSIKKQINVFPLELKELL